MSAKKAKGRKPIGPKGERVVLGAVTLTEEQRATFAGLLSVLGSRAAVIRHLIEEYKRAHPSR